ncbi:very-long-chain (3R)-3-hydroxyacyl-CoA dehydratase-like [Artemia franciscana]|uniref:very-long-chain (3R)-3-hydroxyacyl-CoA dehydratase-like n=1 Tax=Artemia franciscana TaxID=6661 RepID=UPI0032DB4A1F
MVALNPIVYWAQNQKDIFLRVELRDVKDENVVLLEDSLRFEATGVGACGLDKYAFHFNFFESINPGKSKYRATDRQVEFSLRKENCGKWWKRLTEESLKLPWLKIDFDKWKSPEDFEEETRDILQDRPDILRQLQEDEGVIEPINYRQVYLFVYNMAQFIGFLYIFVVMMINYAKKGPDSMEETFSNVGEVFKFVQLMAFLEILHVIFGYTKGGLMACFIQVLGRFIVLFGCINSEPRMQTKPVVFYLFFIWSLVELIRYPYYMFRVYNIEVSFLTWLRYTIWIALYPLGFLCEGVVYLRTIPYAEETGVFTIALPNAWNFAFHFPTAIRTLLLCFFFPGMYTTMIHMQRQRKKKLGPSYLRQKGE